MALSPANVQALEARGIDVESAVRHGVADSRKPGYDVQFEYRVGSVPVNHKYRTLGPEKRFCQDENSRKTFWNFDCLTDQTLDGPLIITEGEFDSLIALQCGYSRVISCPDGAPAVEQGASAGAKYSYVDDALATLAPFSEIILCTDGDGPGLNLLNDLALRLSKARCKWVKYPVGCKDLNDAFSRYGENGVRATLTRAKWMRVDGIYKMSELPPLPYARPFDVGISGLEPHYRMRLGDFCVITGSPGGGKTSFINNLAANMVSYHGWKVAMASFEQMPQLDHRRALRTLHCERRVRDMTPDEISEADAWIDQNFSFIVPSEDDAVTLQWTLERCSAAVLRHGANLIVVDPFNEMDAERPPDMTQTEFVGYAIKQFKKFAAKHRVHFIVVVHPKKLDRLKSGELPRVNLYDCADSAHWYNKSDVGIVVGREGENTLINVAKSRYFSEIGTVGSIVCRFDAARGRFSGLQPDEMI